MPQNNKEDERPEYVLLDSEVNSSITSDHYGLTPKFLRTYTDSIKRVEDKVKQSLKNTNNDNPEQVFNTMKQLQHITETTFRRDTYDTNLATGGSLGLNSMTSDGFRMIYGENENREDSELFNFHASIFANYRNLVSEYRNIGRLIPEVHRCADMKARDILAINEITKRAITNVYTPDTSDQDRLDSKSLHDDPVNKQIEEKILDRYEVEDRLPRYLMDSLIEGAKPVVVYPYKDILEMAQMNQRAYAEKFADFNMKTKNSRSSESLDSIMLDYHNKSQRLIPDMNDPKYHIFGTEDGHETVNVKNLTDYRDMVVDQFCSTEDFNEYAKMGLEDISNNIKKAENDELMSIYASPNNLDKTIKAADAHEKFRDLQSQVKIDGALSDHFKDQIMNAVKTIDANVEFFDQTEAPMAMAIDNFRRLMQFTGYHENPSTGVMAYGVDKQKKYTAPEGTIDQDPLSKFNSNKKISSVLDEFEDEFSPNNESLVKDCLIKEYDAEDVIPVIISGKHVGYYVIETSPYTGNSESVNKRNCNFTDMFLNLGMNNDSALSPSPATTGSFGAGMQAIPMGGMGPVSDAPTLGVTGAGSMSIAGGLDIAGYDVGPIGDDAMRRNNIMKKIIFNVLQQKLNRHDLTDDKTFTDTIMALIRDGAIVQNRMKIIYIPEHYMCYFTPGLDGNGIPQSFMKDCLFTCYEKVLVNMNNIMTRLTRTGTRDKITVNVGKAKNIGATIRSIENALTTRRLNVESPFTSLSRVLKAASLSESIIVPVFDGGEKLFEYEDLTKTNQVEPDDTLEEKLTNQIVTALKCPITITNPYQEEDFASIAASRNAEYRFDIIKCQKVYTKTINKFIKLLIVGSGLYADLKKGNEKISIKDFNVLLSPPENLNMKNANDTFSTVQSYVDNIISITINPDDDTEVTNQTRFSMKQKLYQKLAPGLNLDEYILMAEDLKRHDGVRKAMNKKIDNSINDQINNTEFKPLVANPDGTVTEAENQGSGNSDSGGW